MADLPPGRDPGDLASSQPELLPAAIEGARPFLRFRLDRAFAAADLSTPEGRARAAETALALLAEHPAEMVRDQYLMDIAGRCRLDPERLRPQLQAFRSDPARRRQSAASAASASRASAATMAASPPSRSAATNGARLGGARRAADRPALEVLRHAVHNRTEIEPWLRLGLFADPTHRRVLEALAASPTAGEAVASAPPDVADLLARLTVEEPGSEPFEAVRRLLTEVARAEMADLRLRSATAENPADVLAGSAFLGRCIDDLRNPRASVEAADRLLAFLAERVGDGG